MKAKINNFTINLMGDRLQNLINFNGVKHIILEMTLILYILLKSVREILVLN